jgi:hypothetical protein
MRPKRQEHDVRPLLWSIVAAIVLGLIVSMLIDVPITLSP